MENITGKIKKIIYQSDNDYIVALFRVSKTSKALKDINNKTITITGIVVNPNLEANYELEGEYVLNPKYGYQFNVGNYSISIPTTKDAVIEYLSSSLVKGCGKKTAEDIYNALGDDAINLIKDNPDILKKVPKLTDNKISKIYNSIMANTSVDEILIKLKELGFTINESSKIIKSYGLNILNIIKEDIYILTDIIDFKKLDSIFCLNKDFYDPKRQKACLVETLIELSTIKGDTYSYYEEIEDYLKNFGLVLDNDLLDSLIVDGKIIKEENKYFLYDNYVIEEEIAIYLREITKRPLVKNNKLDTYIDNIEFETGIKYNADQKNAIINALNNRVSIISGGPGTGKTTIINAIVRIYTAINKLNPIDTYNAIALLAPTGRASKKMAMATGYTAGTIHRYLKWNKDTDTFGINELNPLHHKLVIVDEVSMIDSNLFCSLLKGLTSNIQLVLVGDHNQLPSVGAGLVLNDLINSNLFSFNPLEEIFRQSSNSYIPYLAKEIKENKISDDLFIKKDDYNFLESSSSDIKFLIRKICNMITDKGLTDKDIIILAPLYKGINGIDNLNSLLQEIFNPKDKQKEIKIGEVTYREKDKVIQLVNNPDLNVFNGDVGYITSIDNKDIYIDFDGSQVIYKKGDMKDIKHAYAISIHKSQGSEFSHVIMPIESHYKRMLYNKLIYTGVSRAKKSLVIIGEKDALIYAIKNNYSNERKTNLLNKLEYIFKR